MGAVKNLVKGVGKLVGFDSDAIANASKQQAQAISDSSRQQAIADREAARGAQMAQETQMAQAKAGDAAKELLAQPVAQADVAAAGAPDEVDPATGQRKKPRDAYSNASINI